MSETVKIRMRLRFNNSRSWVVEVSKQTAEFRRWIISGVVIAWFLFLLLWILLILLLAYSYSYKDFVIYHPILSFEKKQMFDSFGSYLNFCFKSVSAIEKELSQYSEYQEIFNHILLDRNSIIVFLSFTLIFFLANASLGIVCSIKFANNFKDQYRYCIKKDCILSIFFGIIWFNILFFKFNRIVLKSNKNENQNINEIEALKNMQKNKDKIFNTQNDFNNNKVFTNNTNNINDNIIDTSNQLKNRLIEVNNLKEQGLINEEEFQKIRKEILKDFN